ncbi:MAG: magnesium transporter CorA family protein [Gemmatimonadetes bacterium]|nr:magnesium transporter CorA family protein [Gemmatimonadota bacterium]
MALTGSHANQLAEAGPPQAADPSVSGPSASGLRVLVEGPFTWLDVEDPSGPALEELARRFGWHELAVEDCRNHPQLAKLDPFGDHVFLIANSIRFDSGTGKLHLRELDFFMGETYLVTVHDGPSVTVEAVAASLPEGRITTPALALHALLDSILDRFMPTLDEIGDTIERIESEILDDLHPTSLRKMFRLRRNLVAFRRAASAQRELLNTLSRRDTRFVPADLVIYFRDVYDHVVRTMELIESYRDLLTGALDIYLTRAASRTNDTVKALTLIATIILPLTLITGWYGMNVAGLPFAEDPQGIWYITAGMVVFTLALLSYFRWKRWL